MYLKKGFEVIIKEDGPYKDMNGTVIDPDRYYPFIEVRVIKPSNGNVVDRLFHVDKLKHFLHDVFNV